MEEIQLTSSMRPNEYRVEFRPKYERILGSLEATRPAELAIQKRHARLVEDLERLLHEFDAAMDQAERADVSAHSRALERSNRALAGIITSALDWLNETARALNT